MKIAPIQTGRGNAAELATAIDTMLRETAIPDVNLLLCLEGPKDARITRAAAECLTEDALTEYWTIRIFGNGSELLARRRDPNSWQWRIVTERPPVTGKNTLEIELLGRATGMTDVVGNSAETSFVPEPNRYRRARLKYPGVYDPGQRVTIAIQSVNPDAGPPISCWLGLKKVTDTRSTTARSSTPRPSAAPDMRLDEYLFGEGVTNEDSQT